MPLTPVQKLRARGLQTSLRYRGIAVATDTLLQDGKTPETLCVLVEDQTPPQDPATEAKQRLPVFAMLTGLEDSIQDPQAIGLFTEINGDRKWAVIEYRPCTDPVTVKWFCEQLPADPNV